MVMVIGKERIEKFWRNWTSRKKLEKWNCYNNERNCDEKEIGRILKKMKMWRKWTKLRQKRSWQDLKKKVVCKTALQVRGQKSLFILEKKGTFLKLSKILEVDFDLFLFSHEWNMILLPKKHLLIFFCKTLATSITFRVPRPNYWVLISLLTKRSEI